MTGVSLGVRTGSYGSLQQAQNEMLHTQNFFILRKTPKMSLSGSREKERFLPYICRILLRRQVGMLILVTFALLVFTTGFLTVNKEHVSGSSSLDFEEGFWSSTYYVSSLLNKKVASCGANKDHMVSPNTSVKMLSIDNAAAMPHPCRNFAFPPPPPGERRRIGPRPCPVCYLPVDQAIARMPRTPSPSSVLNHLTYYREINPTKTYSRGGSDFGGYPSLMQRNESFDIKESMTVHCGFAKGCKPGDQTGFDIDASDLREMEEFHEVIVASAIFGNYDVIQQPRNVSSFAREHVPFYMFVDEETETSLRNSSHLYHNNRVGLWRIIRVHNVPYNDARRNGKGKSYKTTTFKDPLVGFLEDGTFYSTSLSFTEDLVSRVTILSKYCAIPNHYAKPTKTIHMYQPRLGSSSEGGLCGSRYLYKPTPVNSLLCIKGVCVISDWKMLKRRKGNGPQFHGMPVPKLLLHRLFPNVRYSIWIDGKLQLVADPYQILERFLWRENATFSISRHYRRFDVFEEAEANKAAGKYNNESIDQQIGFYKKEGLTHYSEAKLPITSDVPEGCVIIREHIPITNLFTCLWFNEVDRFTSRDQLSFAIVRDRVMSKTNWTVNMFLDCERRNFVIQAYHRDLLEQRAQEATVRVHSPPPPPSLVSDGVTVAVRSPVRKSVKRGKKAGSRRHRKIGAGHRDHT